MDSAQIYAMLEETPHERVGDVLLVNERDERPEGTCYRVGAEHADGGLCRKHTFLLMHQSGGETAAASTAPDLRTVDSTLEAAEEKARHAPTATEANGDDDGDDGDAGGGEQTLKETLRGYSSTSSSSAQCFQAILAASDFNHSSRTTVQSSQRAATWPL